jgi:hypothetical protein
MLAAFWAKSGSPAASVIGGAVDLDGSSEYFVDSASNVINWSNLTIICWFYPTTATGYRALVAARRSSPYVALRLENTYRMLGWQVHITASPGCSEAVSLANSWETNQWNMAAIAVARNGPSAMYCNNTNVAFTGMANTNYIGGGQIELSREGGFERKFPGRLDDVSIWNRTLTSNEVMELYNGGAGKPATSLSTGTNGLVRYWKLDDKFAYPAAALTQAVDSVSGTFAAGIGIDSNDFVTGIVPQ